ncbi:MAG: 3-oxoadipate CoA-transferase, partial [Rubrivivax sp.]|nr:3-oxoadipate CoA-transferase [Rubrivivax sp.]
KAGEPKLVERCSYPLTGVACVRRVFTDLAVIDLSGDHARVLERADGVTLPALQALTGFALHEG